MHLEYGWCLVFGMGRKYRFALPPARGLRNLDLPLAVPKIIIPSESRNPVVLSHREIKRGIFLSEGLYQRVLSRTERH